METADDCVTEGCWRDVGPGVGLDLAAIVLGAAERWEEGGGAWRVDPGPVAAAARCLHQKTCSVATQRYTLNTQQ